MAILDQNRDDRALILFVRPPVLGEVKSRIAASIGAKKALEIYIQLLNHTKYIAAQLPSHNYVFYAGNIVERDLWSDVAKDKIEQEGENLGDRMYHAFERVLKYHGRAVIIGSDCAQLRPQHILSAFEALNTCDVVVGPSRDGGYYLLGMNQVDRALFEGIPWSTDRVAQLTIDAARQHGLSVNTIEELADIDIIEDWQVYGLPFILGQ